MRLSIVIVNWNTRDYLMACLGSVERHAPADPYEIIVVDNASSDGSAAAVVASFPMVRLIALGENTGYARGNNTGIEASTGSCVLLLNPDTEFRDNSLQRALDILAARPEIGVLAAKLVHPDGRVQRSVRGFPTPFGIACEALGLSHLFPQSRLISAYRMPWFDYERASEVDQPMASFLMIRRSVLETVGLMDPAFPIFFNDVDWCFRAKKAGVRILFDPSVSVVHHGGASTRLVSAAMAWESRRSLLAYMRKHYRGLRYLPLYGIAWAASWVYAAAVSAKRRRAPVEPPANRACHGAGSR